MVAARNLKHRLAGAFSLLPFLGQRKRAVPCLVKSEVFPKVLSLCLLCRMNYQWCFDIPSKAAIKDSIQEREASGRFGALVSTDISNGLEKVCLGLHMSLV